MAWKFLLNIWCLCPAVSLWILRSCNFQCIILELYSHDYALLWEEHVVWIQDDILGEFSLTRVSYGRSSLSGREGTFFWLSLFCPACAFIKTVSIWIKIILSKAKIKAIIKHIKMLVHKSLYMPTPKQCLEYHTTQCILFNSQKEIYDILIWLLLVLKTWVFSKTFNFKQILMWCECLVWFRSSLLQFVLNPFSLGAEILGDITAIQ